MNKEQDLELVEWTLDDLFSELRRISLVSEPAIESDFMMFGLTEIKFKQTDEQKRVITGPAMRPGMKIKRYRENGDAYWGYFTEEVVTKAAQLFFKRNSNSNKTNLEHDFELDGVYVFESWIVENPEIDKSKALGFSGVKKGDWFVSMKVENDILWNNYLKTGIIKGFSVEVKADEKTIETFNLIEQILDSKMNEDWKLNAILTMIDIDAKPYVDETGDLKKEPVEGLEFKDSYNDYPEAAKKNAQAALRWAEKNGWGSCGTEVGKKRANQLAGGENITRDTIARMAAFERHRGNSKKELGDGCGRLMWLAWGGDEGVEWATRKLKQIDKDTEDFKCKAQGGDGKRVNGEPDMRCPENKGGGSGEKSAERSPMPKKRKEAPEAGGAYDKSKFNNGEKAPNGRDMYDILGPEWKNPELRQANVEKGLIAVSDGKGGWINQKISETERIKGRGASSETPFRSGHVKSIMGPSSLNKNSRAMAENNSIEHSLTAEQVRYIADQVHPRGKLGYKDHIGYGYKTRKDKDGSIIISHSDRLGGDYDIMKYEPFDYGSGGFQKKYKMKTLFTDPSKSYEYDITGIFGGPHLLKIR